METTPEAAVVPSSGAVDRREGDTRYRLLDVFRGVACLMVVLHHAGFAVVLDATKVGGVDGWFRRAAIGLLWRMNLGVPLFFVISGYCIAASADASRRRGSGAFRFLARRVWRIYPPYWAAVLVFVLTTGGLDAVGLRRLHDGGPYALKLDSPGEIGRAQWLGNLTLTETWRPLVHPPEAAIYTRVAWSLCFEEQFYFVCFAILLLAPRRLFAALAITTVAAIGLRVALADVGMLARIEGTFPRLWHEFAVGIAAYWRLNVATSLRSKRAVEVGLVALAAIGFAFPGAALVEYSTATSALFGLLLIALWRYDIPSERLAWLAPFRACGLRCYSIYLVHLPICTVVNLFLVGLGLTAFWTRALVVVPVASALAVGASWLFFFGVERHFLNTRPRHGAGLQDDGSLMKSRSSISSSV